MIAENYFFTVKVSDPCRWLFQCPDILAKPSRRQCLRFSTAPKPQIYHCWKLLGPSIYSKVAGSNNKRLLFENELTGNFIFHHMIPFRNTKHSSKNEARSGENLEVWWSQKVCNINECLFGQHRQSLRFHVQHSVVLNIESWHKIPWNKMHKATYEPSFLMSMITRILKTICLYKKPEIQVDFQHINHASSHI